MSPKAPSGEQIHLSSRDHHATIVAVGGAVREYSVAGRDVFVPFAENEISPAFNAAVLLPWPNRLRDGQYTVDGTAYQVPVSEPARGTALHGLACWQRWTLTSDSADRTTAHLHLAPSPGYPFDLECAVTYELSGDGLTVTATTTNVGYRKAPYGIGFHPWLSPGDANLDDCTFQLDAVTRITTDDRLLPLGSEPARGTYDLSEARSLRGVDLDDAFVDVRRDAAGLSWARLAAPDGHTAAIWMDRSMDTWQVCSGDHVEPASVRRTGMAAEPMSCIADAFRTGDRLVWIEPGAQHTVRWGATLL